MDTLFYLLDYYQNNSYYRQIDAIKGKPTICRSDIRSSDMETQTPSVVRPVLHRLHDAQNKHDIEAFVACFDVNYLSEQPVHPDRTFRGSEQVRKNWSAIFSNVLDFRSDLLRTTSAPDAEW